MSSLLTTASPWTDDAKPPKKRTATMQNAINGRTPMMPSSPSPSPAAAASTPESDVVPPGIAEVQTASLQRTARIHELLDNAGSSGDVLANFEPLDHPILQKRTEMETAALQIPSSNLRSSSTSAETQFHPSSSNNDAASSNYHHIYERPPHQPMHQPVLQPLRNHDDRWMEKMNYIIYLLEQQQNEKTSHITEEFVLYTFLGVFVIFVVDAFSRGGKYIR